MKWLVSFIIIVFCHSCFAKEKKQVLTVYTTKSFASNWAEDSHPLSREFEEFCNCKTELVALDSGGTLLSRLMFEGKGSKADIVIGLDLNLLYQAEATGLFLPHNLSAKTFNNLPMEWNNESFIPYDFGYFSFIYNRAKFKSPPTSLKELVESDRKYKIIIQDPRSSTVGMGLLTWMKHVYGDDAKSAWKKLFKKVLTVSGSWGESYGLFMHGEADMVMSYSTSPAYHMIAESDFSYAAADFSEGHYLQVEVAGILYNSVNHELSRKFLEFLMSKNFQRYIPLNNFMYPVIDIGDEMPKAYSELITPRKMLFFPEEVTNKNKNSWIAEWLSAASQK
jgi:thiamine transport system substrate-binding protein